MELNAQTLRDALEAYVQTFRVRDRLKEHIGRQGLSGDSERIEAALDACLQTAEEFLYNYPGGVPWTDAFKKEYEEHLLSQYSWLDRASMDRVMAFSGWLCWHEGLNAR
jgi:hypothetical protein